MNHKNENIMLKYCWQNPKASQ